jgi:hypothetical protein
MLDEPLLAWQARYTRMSAYAQSLANKLRRSRVKEVVHDERETS